MKLGFVGTGTIAAAIIDGLGAAGTAASILVSPRNAEVAAALAERHANVRIAADNQAVLDGSDMVVLAVRPQVAREVIGELRFRPDHHVVSLIATVSLDDLRRMTGGSVATITRAVPLPSVARCQGPTAVYPPNQAIETLFGQLGTAIPLNDEADFDVFTSATAVMASYFAFAGTVTAWMERHGIADDAAYAFVAQMLRGLATAGSDQSFAVLADEHQTRGGLNEQVVRAITTGGIVEPLDEALDAVLARLKGAPA
jgi:pyrroline-5-carboxylate reductase